MYFLGLVTLATAALAVPFSHRLPHGTGTAPFPSFPTGSAGVPPPPAFPTLSQPLPAYHPSITYATTPAAPTEAAPQQTFAQHAAQPDTQHHHHPKPPQHTKSYPVPPVSLPTGTAPGPFPTGGSTGFPTLAARSPAPYAASLHYARTAQPEPTSA
ncbi:hypothetical protein M426DRAFT_8784 [Hypoxylon sp. CI-4A]|nr:hypothetical protein M426DRAFT_8784 [Hypoxylon sp. CI-4A]